MYDGEKMWMNEKTSPRSKPDQSRKQRTLRRKIKRQKKDILASYKTGQKKGEIRNINYVYKSIFDWRRTVTTQVSRQFIPESRSRVIEKPICSVLRPQGDQPMAVNHRLPSVSYSSYTLLQCEPQCTCVRFVRNRRENLVVEAVGVLPV
jgi:hypothetical protein